jgi:hypothetical protein
MKLKKIRKVTFDELTHSYWLGEKELLGITSLMKKYGLAVNYSAAKPEVLEAAAAKGTALHRLLEDYDNGIPVQPTKGLDDYRKLGLNHVASEYLITDGKTVASKIDKVYELSETEVELSDVKTTTKIHTRSLQWQLGIYKYLFELQNKGISVKRCTVLHFDKNTGDLLHYKEIDPVTKEEVEALLTANREGTIFMDTEATTDISAALSSEEVAEYNGIAEKVMKLKAALDELKARCSEIEGKVLEYMLANSVEEIEADCGSFKVKKAYTRSTIDSSRLKKEMPEVAQKYTKITEVAPSLVFNPNI